MRFEHWLYTLPLMWRSIVRRRDVDRELDDEIRYHLETAGRGARAERDGSRGGVRHARRGFGGTSTRRRSDVATRAASA